MELVIGSHFITVYFKTHKDMDRISKNLYRYWKRVHHKYLNIQRDNFVHRPGDVPRFHNGVPDTKGPHFHVLYPDSPSEDDIQELHLMLRHRLVSGK